LNCELTRLAKKNPFKTDNYWESLKLNTEARLAVHGLPVPDLVRHLVQGLTLRHPRHRLTAEDALRHHLFTPISRIQPPSLKYSVTQTQNKENAIKNSLKQDNKPVQKRLIFLPPIPVPSKIIQQPIRTLQRVVSNPAFQTQPQNQAKTLCNIDEVEEDDLTAPQVATQKVLPLAHRPLQQLPSLVFDTVISRRALAPLVRESGYHLIARTQTMTELLVSGSPQPSGGAKTDRTKSFIF